MKLNKIQGMFTENFDNFNLIYVAIGLVLVFFALLGYFIYKIIEANI